MTSCCFAPEAQVTFSHSRICATLITGIGIGAVTPYSVCIWRKARRSLAPPWVYLGSHNGRMNESRRFAKSNLRATKLPTKLPMKETYLIDLSERSVRRHQHACRPIQRSFHP